MKSVRAVLDTNVIISAIIFGGKPRQLIYTIHEGKFDAFTSKDIIDEVLEILEVKFEYPQNKLITVENELTSIIELVEPGLKLSAIKDDTDDDKIIECAVAAEADYIVSGDKHLLSYGKYGNIEIIKAADFLELF